jgi:hypothetical protein
MPQMFRDRDGDRPGFEAIYPILEGKALKQKNPQAEEPPREGQPSLWLLGLRPTGRLDGGITENQDRSSCWPVTANSKQWIVVGGWDDLCETGRACPWLSGPSVAAPCWHGWPSAHGISTISALVVRAICRGTVRE